MGKSRSGSCGDAAVEPAKLGSYLRAATENRALVQAFRFALDLTSEQASCVRRQFGGYLRWIAASEVRFAAFPSLMRKVLAHARVE